MDDTKKLIGQSPGCGPIGSPMITPGGNALGGNQSYSEGLRHANEHLGRERH